jgi:hypothetical protein
MDLEQTIAEIEWLERIFTEPMHDGGLSDAYRSLPCNGFGT